MFPQLEDGRVDPEVATCLLASQSCVRPVGGSGIAMIFETTVHGIPCQCQVTAWSPSLPMRVYGSGYGDAEPPEPEEFEFQILDRRGRQAPWLGRYLTVSDSNRLKQEFLKTLDEV